MSQKSALVDAKGNPIITNTIPTIKWKEHLLPIRIVRESDRAPIKNGGLSPFEMLREMRAMYLELQDRFTFLATGLSVLAKDNPELEEFFNAAGIHLKDLDGKTIYPKP